jgi:hypothetical protein
MFRWLKSLRSSRHRDAPLDPGYLPAEVDKCFAWTPWDEWDSRRAGYPEFPCRHWHRADSYGLNAEDGLRHHDGYWRDHWRNRHSRIPAGTVTDPFSFRGTL